ncbi:MAG: SPFH domain-containing protein, partial [Actinomycetota bacterium]|nr:SPFH domain-containing protein [Actinomycetota bacterium]
MSDIQVTQLVPDKVGKVRNGITMIIIWLINLPAMIVLWALSGVSNGGTILPAIILSLFFIIAPMCLYMLQPNQAAVLTLFGAYRGSDETQGLRFTNLFYQKNKFPLLEPNYTPQTQNQHDANGNPIEIGAVVVWRVVDVAKAVFGVENFTNYVHTQSEAAVRNLARSYPYDSFEDENEITLIGDASEVNDNLRTELQERATAAGVEILEARLNDLAYAPEIAEAMLRRQQASAIVAARAKIVEG